MVRNESYRLDNGQKVRQNRPGQTIRRECHPTARGQRGFTRSGQSVQDVNQIAQEYNPNAQQTGVVSVKSRQKPAG